MCSPEWKNETFAVFQGPSSTLRIFELLILKNGQRNLVESFMSSLFFFPIIGSQLYFKEMIQPPPYILQVLASESGQWGLSLSGISLIVIVTVLCYK